MGRNRFLARGIWMPSGNRWAREIESSMNCTFEDGERVLSPHMMPVRRKNSGLERTGYE
jgi:hypothetical protein